MQMSRFLLVAGVLLLAGCGKSKDGPEPDGGPRDETRIDVQDLLGKSREKLAELEHEWGEKIRLEETDLQKSRDDRPFLGNTRFPSIVPVWQQATWSAEAGLSLPPYL